MLAKILARPYVDLLHSGPNFESMSNQDLITCFIHSNSDWTTNVYDLSTKDRNDMIKSASHTTTRKEIIEILQDAYHKEEFEQWTKRAHENIPQVLYRGQKFLTNHEQTMEDLVARTVCMGYNTNGSGVVVGPDSIVTCAHLVSPHVGEMVGRYKVCYLWQGGTIVRALSRCVAVDPNYDLALLQLIETQTFPKLLLPPPPFMARSIEEITSLRCILIGNPSDGSEYAKHKPWRVLIDRTTKPTPVSMRRQERILGDIQHEFDTYWGDSGGSIYNASGVLMGIHNAYSHRFQILTAVSAMQIQQFVDAHRGSLQNRRNPFTYSRLGPTNQQQTLTQPTKNLQPTNIKKATQPISKLTQPNQSQSKLPKTHKKKTIKHNGFLFKLGKLGGLLRQSQSTRHWYHYGPSNSNHDVIKKMFF